MTGCVDKEKQMVIVYFDFTKAFDRVSHITFIVKLMRCGLDKWKMMLVENWQVFLPSVVLSSMTA